MSYQNWFDGRDPLPVRVAILSQDEELKEDISVENKSAMIIKENGVMIPAKMERKMGLIGKY